VLDAGPTSIDTIVSRVYQGLQADLMEAAAENVHAHLIKLQEEGRALKSGGDDAPLTAVQWTLRASP
jgi:hypothetical protein